MIGLVVLGDQLLKPFLVQELESLDPVPVRQEREEAVLLGPWSPGFLFGYESEEGEILELEVERGRFDDTTLRVLGAGGQGPGRNFGVLVHRPQEIDGGPDADVADEQVRTCQTSLAVFALDEIAVIRFLPGELRGSDRPHLRAVRVVAQTADRVPAAPETRDLLRIELQVGTPPDGSPRSPGCEREIELGDWRSRLQAPLHHAIVVAGGEVRFEFQQIEGARLWTADGSRHPLDFGDPWDPTKTLRLRALRVERPVADGRRERLFEARSARSQTTIELRRLELRPDQIQLELGGRARLSGDRAPTSSLYYRFRDRPLTSAFLALLFGTLVSAIFKVLKLAFSRRRE